MAVLKCTVCGGELNLNADMSVGVCQYCDSTITIPKNLERKANLYNLAVFHRQNNEFDKAIGIFEELLKEDSFDAEAHWGMVLSKYGIEYVQDPVSGERKPTCHRTQFVPILVDPNYRAALEYADSDAARIYQKEAERISAIQLKVIEISRNQPPYDIFICYKESDELGKRTEDSVIAQDLFYALSKQGYRVFFARKTLETMFGVEYEPVIFSALNSAKVMVVLGTKPDHFQAVWVRNEWSRFLKMARDSEKTIIPAYRDMSPYELPAELAAFQSLDMSKIGFLQELQDGIDRLLRTSRKQTPKPQDVVVPSKPRTIEDYLNDASASFKAGRFDEAENLYSRVAEAYPNSDKAWWGLLLSKTKNLTSTAKDFKELNQCYLKASALASDQTRDDYRETYLGYLRFIAPEGSTAEIRSANIAINNIKKIIYDIRSDQDKLLAEKVSKCVEYDIDGSSRKSSLSTIKKLDKVLTRFKVLNTIALILVISSVAILVAAFTRTIPLTLFPLAGVPFLPIIAIGKKYPNSVESAKEMRTTIQMNKNNISHIEKIRSLNDYQAIIKGYDDRISLLKIEEQRFNERLQLLEGYLNSPKNTIETNWIASQVREIGLELSSSIEGLDEGILAQRDELFKPVNRMNAK